MAQVIAGLVTAAVVITLVWFFRKVVAVLVVYVTVVGGGVLALSGAVVLIDLAWKEERDALFGLLGGAVVIGFGFGFFLLIGRYTDWTKT